MSHSASRLKCSAEVVDWCTQNLGHQGHEQARPVNNIYIFQKTTYLEFNKRVTILYIYDSFLFNAGFFGMFP